MNHRYLFGCIAPIKGAPNDWITSLKGKYPQDSKVSETQEFYCGSNASCVSSSYIDPDITVMLIGHPYRTDSSQGRLTNFTLADFAHELKGLGAKAFAKLGGSFAMAVHLHRDNRYILAVDRFAVENIYFVNADDSVYFSNSATDLSSHHVVDNEFSLQSILDYLYFHCIPSPDTGFKNMQRLLPGQYLEVSPDKVTLNQYWEPHYSTVPNAEPERLKSLLRDAVDRRLADVPTACFLSGGLDSSTITGLCAEMSAAPITAVTIGFDAEGYDETAYARAVADKLGINHETYRVTPADIVENISDIVSTFDSPFGNASAIPTYFCAKLASEIGAKQIFAGDGGDELFGGNTRYAKQLIFESYFRLPKSVRNRLVEPIARTMQSLAPNPFSSKVLNYVNNANIELPLRAQSYNLLNRFDYEQFLHPDFLQATSLRKSERILSEIYFDGVVPESVVNRLLKLDWRLTLADSDLMKVTHMSDLANIKVMFPMLDERVVDFAGSLAPKQKVNLRQMRPFFRSTFSSILPKSTLNKAKHGFGLPFGVWLDSDNKLKEKSIDSLQFLERQKIVIPNFHNHFFSREFVKNPDYYGVFIWILISLSIWLQNRQVRLK